MNRYTKEDLHYIHSLNSVIRQKPSQRSEILLWVILLVFLTFLIWAWFTEIDEITKGAGTVIPSKHMQVIQSLDGGIVSEILVKEGQLVDRGEVLLKINAKDSLGHYQENRLRYNELQAKALRLHAEASLKPLKLDLNISEEMLELMEKEKELNAINREGLQHQIRILEEERKQSQSVLSEALSKEKNLKESYELMQEKITIMKPLVKKALVSSVEYLDLKQQAVNIAGQISEVRSSIPRLKSSITASKKKIEKAMLDFQAKAREEYTNTSAEIARLKESNQILQNKVNRTDIKSPVRGIVQRVMFKTIGGVIQPGVEIMEIVPIDDKLLVQAKINPSDIAYIYPGQRAKVKFTAYDFTVYGGLFGTVTQVSADTIKDENNNYFYLVQIETDKNYLMRNNKKFNLLIGMITDVNIITGKKTIMDFLIKPLQKTKEEALTER